MDQPKEPVFLDVETVIEIHRIQIREFGGPGGVRDMDLLQSALGGPTARYMYDDEADIFDLAAEYCSKIAKNHPFIDGNKRAGLATGLYFLAANGISIPDRNLNPYGALIRDENVAGVVEAHAAGNPLADINLLGLLFFGLLGPKWILDATESAHRAAMKEVDERKLIDPGEKKAVFCDSLMSQKSVNLMTFCQEFGVNPKRIHDIDAAGRNAILQQVPPTFQRIFGMVLSEFPDLPSFE